MAAIEEFWTSGVKDIWEPSGDCKLSHTSVIPESEIPQIFSTSY